MERGKTDRRVQRTRRQLREALLALIVEKGYDAVTIEEITERADLGRTTFYLHYRDKEELLLESIEALSEDLRAQIERTPMIEWDFTNDQQPPILLVFHHAAENASLYRIILHGEGATRAEQGMRNLIARIVLNVLTVRVPKEGLRIAPSVPPEVFANYFAGALMAFITWWLEQNMPYTPEEMSSMFRRLFFSGGFEALGL